MSRRVAWTGLFALLAGTAYLRFVAIGWGAPFVYHPDEHFILQPALDIVRTGNLDPHWFQYPSLLLYLQAALVALLQPFTGASLESNYLINGIGPWDALPEQWPFVLAGRLLVATSAVLGVVLLARVGERLHGAATGLLAGAFLMVAPLHNQSGHYLTTDVPAVSLVILCMAATVASKPRWWLAGLLAGLAAGTKYTAALAVLVPLLAALDAPSRAESDTPAPRFDLLGIVDRVLRIQLGFLVGFLLSTPYALLDVPAFLDGLEAQRRNYLAWSGQQGNFQWYLEYLYLQGLGQVPAILAAAGLLFGVGATLLAAWRRQQLGLRLAFLLPPLLYVPWLASYPSRAERNLILILPFLCLAAAEILRRACALVRPPWLGSALLAGLGGLALISAGPSVRGFNQRLQLADNRTLALEWIRQNIPAGTRIAREEYTPQLQKREYAVEYAFSLARQPYSHYIGERFEYLVASSNIYGRAVEPPYIGGEAARGFYQVLFGLPLAMEFPQGPFSNGPTVRIYRVPLAQ